MKSVVISCRASHSDISNAPTAGAERNRPRPQGSARSRSTQATASPITGTEATINVREYPGRAFKGSVTRAAGALDPDLHTMTTEVQVPNLDGALLPGMYVQVAVNLPVPHRVLEIPATALYSDASGLRVATVDATNHIRFVPITIERDTGATLWISTGLTGDERILKIAVPSLLDGDSVEVAPTPPAAPPAAAGSGSAQKSSP